MHFRWGRRSYAITNSPRRSSKSSPRHGSCAATGAPVITLLFTWWLRALGTNVRSGAWCGNLLASEADLITLGKGSTVNRGCVMRPHLFLQKNQAWNLHRKKFSGKNVPANGVPDVLA